MTPEKKDKMRKMYQDNLVQLMALQPELFEADSPVQGCNKLKERPVTPPSQDGET